MSLQVGDKVSFLNEALNGIVSKVIDNKSVEVTTTDGFGIPVLIAELVKTGGAPEPKTQSKSSSSVKEMNGVHIPTRSNLEKKPYLCFAKNEAKNNELYILNNTQNAQYFSIRIQKGGEWVLIYSGKVNKQSYVFVSSYGDKELDGFNKVLIDSLNVDFSTKEHLKPKSAQIKIKATKFYKESSFSEIPILEKNAMLIDASGASIEEVKTHEELRAAVETITKPKLFKGLKVVGKIDLKQEKRGRSRGEIDLHIEKLGVKVKGKSNAQIVQIQLDFAKDFIDKSILAGKREVVLVHGVGNGTLKQEVHKFLKSYYGIKYEQADARSYGEGGTLVHLKG